MNEPILVTSHNWSTKATFTPPLANLTHHLLIPTRQATFIGAIVAIVFIFFGLIGNLILITTILSVKKLRSNIINIFIVSVKQTNLQLSSFFFVLFSYNSMIYSILASINCLSDYPTPIVTGSVDL